MEDKIKCPCKLFGPHGIFKENDCEHCDGQLELRSFMQTHKAFDKDLEVEVKYYSKLNCNMVVYPDMPFTPPYSNP